MIVSAIIIPFLITLDLSVMMVERVTPMRGTASWLTGLMVCVAAWSYTYHCFHSENGWVAVAVAGLYGQLPAPVVGISVTLDVAENLLMLSFAACLVGLYTCMLCISILTVILRNWVVCSFIVLLLLISE